MRIIIVGAAGKAGRAVHRLLEQRGHDIVTVGRTSGDVRCDISDETQLRRMWQQVGQVDAVVSAAGDVTYAPIGELSAANFDAAWKHKGLSQINLVRTGLDQVSPDGSFTLISGIPSRDPVVSGAAAATVNGAIEAFVRAAAIEIAPRRINVVSPSVFTESLADFGDYFPGFPSVDLVDVARGFQKAVEGAATGQVITLP
ncbi:NAD(P)-dependent dehydrogenase (short-subunit alcohol dehydrogenase family) [Stackebrandtia endophytica]|uniref:NAD(P)-dependent dehydrogenase (Short-subunit alcohol dehydrogenase family) n=1 Tax=Stackebrandtia endophytica TaxID=1496996 RepID=A0A543AW35_9ACTN|nr:short chain dehydrogenase [Stackebrandtia endophytica]TQL76795.1 NAD(P)-dependent dehydrogenase (short-subunit alcohol dehydrogenase family) [Stackebrandtia endophytica]